MFLLFRGWLRNQGFGCTKLLAAMRVIGFSFGHATAKTVIGFSFGNVKAMTVVGLHAGLHIYTIRVEVSP